MMKENDTTDRRLLALLQVNARQSVTALARKLGIARTTVQERITRMERNGIIAGYSVLLKRDPFNQYADVVVLVSVANQKIKAITDQLREFPEIVLCQMVSGEFELLCRIRVAHLEDVQPVLEAIGEIVGVERVRSIMILFTAFDHSQNEPVARTARQLAALRRSELG